MLSDIRARLVPVRARTSRPLHVTSVKSLCRRALPEDRGRGKPAGDKRSVVPRGVRWDSVQGIRRRFKKAESAGWLKQVNQKTGGRRRSAVELFYRATGPAIAGDKRRTRPPDSVGISKEWEAFEELKRRVREAILSGSLEARIDGHLSWSVLRLDAKGWAM